MVLWHTASILPHAVVFLGSVLLLRRKRTVPAFAMVLGAALVLMSETLSFLAYGEYLPDSWLTDLGWGMPIGFTSLGWFVFAIGLLAFAISLDRNSGAADHGVALTV